jgi:hypothetical protein
MKGNGTKLRGLVVVSATATICVLMVFGPVIFWPREGRGWGGLGIAETMRRGESIAQAIREFKADHGRFPRVLGELVPRYLSDVPVPAAGSENWIYKVNSDERAFMLKFGVPCRAPDYFYPSCRYSSSSCTWYTDD